MSTPPPSGSSPAPADSADARSRRSGAGPRPNRDAVTTIREDGSRFFLHPADVSGRYTTLRRWTGWILIAIYLALPWIPVGGHPAVFLDVADRRFHLFGLTLAFQDTWLLFFGLTGLGFSFFFVTATLGRVWCGWACPQTVFLDHLYRRVERWIEGDAMARRKLDSAPWTGDKIIRRAGKHVVFVVMSAAIAHLFIAYVVSIPKLWVMMQEAPGENWAWFLFVFIWTAALYFNFAWFREQLCLIICPYGRMQSALIDDHTVNIGYDTRRGEPRGKVGTPDAGACIDCNRCVQVCPTGIDIRQGLQIECIACAACVDACDAVMTKLNRPTGLVRYDSLAGLGGGKTRWWRMRTKVYSLLLAIGAGVALYFISTVRPATLGITRMTGAPYFVDEHSVRNQFLVRLVNKRDVPMTLQLGVQRAPEGLELTGTGQSVTLKPLEEQVRPLILSQRFEHYRGPVEFSLVVREAGGAFTLQRQVEFVGPDAFLLKAQLKAKSVERDGDSKPHHDDEHKESKHEK